MTPQDIVRSYIEQNYRIVLWPAVGDAKGPREPGWPQKIYTLDDYSPDLRVGILTGTEIAPGAFIHDVDLDWSPGSLIAQSLLPPTSFVFGRASKRISHCFYTTPEPLPSVRYEDIDRTCLIELRGTKNDGTIGFQTMVPPSMWSKGQQRETLAFVRAERPAHVEAQVLKRRVSLAAIGLILAKHFGLNGFGHDVRLMWAGYLLRAGIHADELIEMGEAISQYCNNTEVHDVKFVVHSTAKSIEGGKKAKGGPSLARHFGASGKAILARINEWLGRDDDFARVEGIIVKDSQQNIRRAIDRLGKELSYNEFSDKLLVDGQALEDREMNEMWLRIDEEFRFRPTFMFFEKVVRRLAWDNAFHPVKEYLSQLMWDGKPRIESWLIDCAGAEDSAYIRAISAIVLIAAVRRIFHPGAKYDELLVIEGAQGLNKSSALRALCPRSEWFSDDLPLNTTSQRMIESTLGKWIIEAADLAGRRKAEIEHLKASLSRQIDGPARLAYAHLPVERPRQFVIIGTTNSAAYLPDPTGARRFWPVAIQAFDIQKILAVRDQLWAEAKVREAEGASIRLREELWLDAAQQQEKRREIDPWEAPIRTLLLMIQPSGDERRRVAIDDIWAGLSIPLDRRDRSGAIRLAEIMHRLGFKRTTVRVEGVVHSGYVTDRPELLEMREEIREPGEDDAFRTVNKSGGDEPPF